MIGMAQIKGTLSLAKVLEVLTVRRSSGPKEQERMNVALLDSLTSKYSFVDLPCWSHVEVDFL